MLKSYKILFFITLILGSLITISAYSWFSMWIGLEINLLSIIPLMKSSNNLYPTEAMIKYFTMQALASSLILFSVISSLNLSEFLPQHFIDTMMMTLNSAIFIKLGAAPFHAWFPEVSEGLNWLNNLIIYTWQKLAPMILLMYNINLTFYSIIIIFSSLVGSLLGFNQISMRKILAYSSINHIAWMLASLLNFKILWSIYFFIYSIINGSIIMVMSQLNIFFSSQLTMSLNSNKLLKIFLMMNFFSLGGLPPFLGFLPKWLIIENLINSKFYMLSIILILLTLITLYFYLRLTFSTLMFSTDEVLIYSNKWKTTSIIIFNFITIMSLFICTNIFFFL
uniref:NADH-ubiquinone oxidoreductase chain 2 n=1 Tax=Syphrea sp. REN-2018 TaxID=2506510 RepID=A0A411DA07_9CUCU|nr:NADH dehydrogenase subunit 2 [Syphrea sp. REN-2018]